ncbi:MAG TPA: amidohydrolase family protein [Chitinophagaceae bacterium]|nr:amidohydrolase family protein [Chitinophagaceae bacterium]
MASSLSSTNDEVQLEFSNAIAFPGLVNSHDHLDFNLFPQLGNRIYKSYREWGEDIQKNNREIIESVLNVPQDLRIKWGLYKNLVNGFTTVVNHGKHLDIIDPIITVFQGSHSLHSVREKGWKLKLNSPFAGKKPFVIHVGEGTDPAASAEIDELVRWNLFKRKIVAVHGVAMDKAQASAFEALIWCPASNYFMLNGTAKVNELKSKLRVLFGTDSTLSAGWNAWEHIRLARDTQMLNDDELFQSLTRLPGETWRLKDRGVLAEGKKADIVVTRIKDGKKKMDDFFGLNPGDILLVVCEGKIVLFDESLYSLLSRLPGTGQFGELIVNGSTKWVIGNPVALIKEIKKYLPGVKLFDL